MRTFAHLEMKRGNLIVMKFCAGVGVLDIITHANFGDDRFRVFFWGGSEGRTSHFSIILALLSLKHSGTTVQACDICLSVFGQKIYDISSTYKQGVDANASSPCRIQALGLSDRPIAFAFSFSESYSSTAMCQHSATLTVYRVYYRLVARFAVWPSDVPVTPRFCFAMQSMLLYTYSDRVLQLYSDLS